MPRRTLLPCLLLLAGLSARLLLAAQPQFWSLEGARDFLDGQTDGLSVDSEGRMRLAPASRPLFDAAVPYIWCLARDSRGTVYAGTGNEGKVVRFEGGKGSVLFDAPELEVHALAPGPDGKLYVATSPEGKVYAVDAGGQATSFFDPTDKYIWALAFDKSGNLYVGTGAEGRVYRVDRKGEAKTLLTGAETHVTALVLDASGNVYAGSSPGGILYRIDPAGKVFVLHDSAYREVRSLDLGPDGSLYAAVIDGKRDDSPRSIEPLLTPPVSIGGGGEVTVSESITVIGSAPPAPLPSPSPRGPDSLRSGSSKGGLLRMLPTGEVDTLWSSTDETPYAVLATPDGALVGTGNKGQVYRIRNDRTWTMVAAFPAEQVMALSRRADGGIDLATSNAGALHTLEAGLGTHGTFTSKVKDTEVVSSWGRIRWEGTLPSGTEIRIQTRSGNTSTPDSTWTDWSPPYLHKEGDAVGSEHARYLQVRAALHGRDGASPVLDSISTSYLQRNLRPQVTSITVHPPGEVFQKPLSVTGEMEILGLDQGPSEGRPGAPGAPRPPSPPPATSYSRKLYQRGLQTFSWKAEDPNGDALTYDVWYRPLEDTRFRQLRKGLSDAVLAWDTTTVPNGRYVIKITASDAPANPESLALTSDKESAPFDVDNTPPMVTVTLASTRPVRIRAVVKDDSSIVRKAEYSIDGGRWREVHPVDGLSDAREESYDIPVGELTPPGPHVVVVRGTDLLGNVASARVEIP
jgi:sugar lactone lactonase YvrE